MYRSGGRFSGGTVTGATNFSSAVGFADGTAAAPSIAFTSDQDGSGTGLYRPLTAQVGITINGVLSHTFTASSLNMGSATAAIAMGVSGDAIMAWATTNSFRFGNTAGSTVTSRTEMNKQVTAIADNVATATFTVTIPNAANSAVFEVEFLGILGAGGTIGTNEAVATNSYKIAITRTPGVATVATASVAFGAAAANVAGATTDTCVAAVSAMSGAVGATQTFTVNVTITKAAGSSANHIALCYGKLMNLNASGITFA